MVARAPGRPEPGVDGGAAPAGARTRAGAGARRAGARRPRRARRRPRRRSGDRSRRAPPPAAAARRRRGSRPRARAARRRSGSRASRAAISCVTRSGLCSATRSASMPPSPPTAERASSRSRNGLPPVAAWHARHCASSALGANERTTAAAAVLAQRRAGGAASRARAACRRSASSVAGDSSARLATISATGIPSSRCAMWASTPSDALSAQWRVVDEQRQRPLRREVGGQPVERVPGGERVVRARPRVAPRSSTPSSGRGEPRRAREQGGVRLARSTSSNSWRTTPNANARSSSAPRARSVEQPRLGRGRARGVEQRRLADARRPVDHDQAARRPSARPRERAPDRLELGVALEQPVGSRLGCRVAPELSSMAHARDDRGRVRRPRRAPPPRAARPLLPDARLLRRGRGPGAGDAAARVAPARRRSSATSRLRAWLYKIATNACLDAIKSDKRRVPSLESFRRGPVAAALPGPAARRGRAERGARRVVVARETIELTFLAVIQLLPPRQRAVLILRDVLDWSAERDRRAARASASPRSTARSSGRARRVREQLPAGRREDWSAPEASDDRARAARAASSTPTSAATPRPRSR